MSAKGKAGEQPGDKNRARDLRKRIDRLVQGKEPVPAQESPASFVHRKMAELQGASAKASPSNVDRIIDVLIREIANQSNLTLKFDDDWSKAIDAESLVALINAHCFKGQPRFNVAMLGGNDTVENVAIAIDQLGGVAG